MRELLVKPSSGPVMRKHGFHVTTVTLHRSKQLRSPTELEGAGLPSLVTDCMQSKHESVALQASH